MSRQKPHIVGFRCPNVRCSGYRTWIAEAVINSDQAHCVGCGKTNSVSDWIVTTDMLTTDPLLAYWGALDGKGLVHH